MSNCISYSGWTGTTGIDIIVYRDLFFGRDITIEFEINIDHIIENLPYPLIDNLNSKYSIPINEDSLNIHIPAFNLGPGYGINIIDTSGTIKEFEVYDNIHEVHKCGYIRYVGNLRVGFYKFN